MLRQLRFDEQLDAIMASSICIPCDLPYVNSVWMPRRRGDRPPRSSRGGDQSRIYRPVWEFRRRWRSPSNTPPARRGKRSTLLFKRGPAPPPVYQAEYDPAALFDALMVLLGQ